MNKKLAVNFIIIYFLLGVFVAPEFSYNFKVILVSAISILFIGLLFRKNIQVLVFSFASLFLLFGFFIFNFQNEKLTNNPILNYADSEAVIEGYVASYPQKKNKTQTFHIKTSKVIFNGQEQEIKSKIFIITNKLKSYNYGDIVIIFGKLEKMENTDEFNFKEFFSSRGILLKTMMPEIEKTNESSGNFFLRTLFNLRISFEEKLRNIFQEPFFSLVLGLLLGAKTMPGEFMEIFNKVSLTHIIVVSGYNLSVIANFLKGIFQPISRKLAFWLPLLGITTFVLFVGPEPPITRAMIMAFIVLLAKQKGRRVDGVFSLLFAAFLMILLNPLVLKYDPGFQLSFAATLGILIFSDKISKKLLKIKVPNFLSELIASSLSAQLMVLPLVLLYFDRISIVGPIANLLVLPIIPIIMLLSFISGLLAFININLSYFISLLPSVLMIYIFKVSEFFSNFSWAALEFKSSFLFLPIYYFLLFILFLFITRNEEAKET